jgi:aspartyl-tRNA(Asn)/glutamyl-tRNA(Gln) amidotransferase subunit C
MYVKFFYGRVLIASSDRASDSFFDGDAICTELKTTNNEVQAAKVFSQNILLVYYGVKFFSFQGCSEGCYHGRAGNYPRVDTVSSRVFNGLQAKIMELEELDITAQLARLELSDEEAKQFEKAVFQMLEYFSKMREFDVEGLPPTTQMTQINRTRKDAAIVNTDTDAILDNAPELEDRFIVIPNVL